MGIVRPILLLVYFFLAYATYYLIINQILLTRDGLIYLGLFLLLNWYFMNLLINRIKRFKLFSQRLSLSLPKRMYRAVLQQSTKTQVTPKPQVEHQKQTQAVSGTAITLASRYKMQKKSPSTIDRERLKKQALQELDMLIGMDEIKEQTKRYLNHMMVEKERERKGMKTKPITLHMLFLGEAGTGKTTVARIIGKFLAGTGILSKGQFVECDREALVGEHIGATAPKTKAKIMESLGGVLFIDEAYSLAGEGNDFGKEAISTLIKAMEDYGHDWVVIFAGYPREMQKFIKMNSGLPSRLPNKFDFPNYKPNELYQIALKLMAEQDMVMDDSTQKALFKIIAEQWQPRQQVEGNGRWVRNVVEQIRIEQNNRIVQSYSKDLSTIYVEDILKALKRVK